MELCPIKVKIELTDQGNAKYPVFNTLQCVKDANMDWSVYIDKHGTGWHYDKQSCLKDDTAEAEYGIQYGMILVPEDFAKQAVAEFPDLVENMTETQAETFYNDRAHKHENSLDIDFDRLNKIKLLEDMNLKTSLSAEEQQELVDAKDVTKDTPGLRRNKRKKFTDYKTLQNITIKDLKQAEIGK